MPTASASRVAVAEIWSEQQGDAPDLRIAREEEPEGLEDAVEDQPHGAGATALEILVLLPRDGHEERLPVLVHAEGAGSRPAPRA